MTVTSAMLGDATNLLISVSSNGTNVILDLDGAEVHRVIVYLSGSNNALSIQNTDAQVGFCSGKISGSDNQLLLDQSSSGPIVEFRYVKGSSHRIDLDFLPSEGMIYRLRGQNHCISAQPGTSILYGERNNGSHSILLNGEDCD
jgi:hypothetical protein